MINIFSITVTIIVVVMLEDLFLTVMLTLAYSMRRMMAHKSLLRVLATSETMGSSTTICSGKTGTPTTKQDDGDEGFLAGKMKSTIESSLCDTSFLLANLWTFYVNSISLNNNRNVLPLKDGEEIIVIGAQ